jgi:hypothetical protein
MNPIRGLPRIIRRRVAARGFARIFYAVGIVAPTIMIGCGKSQPTDSLPPTKTLQPPVTAISSDIQDWTLADAAGVKETVAKLLADATEGKVDGLIVTEEFKKRIGPSGKDPDREKGYSDEEVAKWAKGKAARFHGKLTLVWAAAKEWAIAQACDGTQAYLLLRLVRPDESAAWKVDWAHTPSKYWGGTVSTKVAGQRFTVATFCDSLFNLNAVDAGRMMTEPFKRKLVTAPGDLNNGRYSLPILAEKLDVLRGQNASYSIGRLERVQNDVIAHVFFWAGNNKKEVDLTLIPGDEPGVWLVNAWVVK